MSFLHGLLCAGKFLLQVVDFGISLRESFEGVRSGRLGRWVELDDRGRASKLRWTTDSVCDCRLESRVDRLESSFEVFDLFVARVNFVFEGCNLSIHFVSLTRCRKVERDVEAHLDLVHSDLLQQTLPSFRLIRTIFLRIGFISGRMLYVRQLILKLDNLLLFLYQPRDHARKVLHNTMCQLRRLSNDDR